MNLRTLHSDDIPQLWRINEEGLPGVGKVSEASLADLLSLSHLPLGVLEGDELIGFVLCLLPRTRYGSLNYAWFNQRYDQFLYVDRVAVSTNHRNKQAGTRLYKQIIEYAERRDLPIAAEVSLDPPNPGSMRFHARHNFKEVGILHHDTQSVTMLIREPQHTEKSASSN